MNKTLLIGLFLIFGLYSYGQVSTNPELSYPEGIYSTKEDFLKKTPNETKELIAKGILWGSKEITDTIPDQCLFLYKHNGKKLRKTFAVCYKGNLYFQAYSILTNREKKDKAQTTNFPNSFCRVLIAGDNFLYTELELANSWKQGLGYGLGGVAGGAIASASIKSKGIVWDVKNQEFNIFRSCKDFNNFITALYPDGVQECKDQQPDLLKVREAIEIIK